MASFWDSVTAPFTGAPIEAASADKAAALRAGIAAQNTDLAAGRQALSTNYTAALQPYAALTQPATGGYNAYADATGANGLEGQARAMQSFQYDPGAIAARDTALTAMQRAGNAGGVAIGNNIYGQGKYASDWANQQYTNYVNRLQPYLNVAPGLAQGQANIYTGLGTGLNTSFTNQGAGEYTGNAAIGNALAEGDLAPMTAGSNIWTGIGKAANLGAGLMTGGASSLFTGGGGAFSPGTNFGGTPGGMAQAAGGATWISPDLRR